MTMTGTTTSDTNDDIDTNNNKKKQGGYGKIPIHADSKLVQLFHFRELYAAFSLLYLHPLESNLPCVISSTNEEEKKKIGEDLQFCNEILTRVSRSFAAVIHQLAPNLVVPVMIFYLVLRALDTIEDDMTYFQTLATTSTSTSALKISALLSFCESALLDPHWKLCHCGDGDERRLLENFPRG